MTNREFWKGKRIAVIGLGPHGEMVEDVKFLIKAGALVSIYDLKSEARLKTHLVFLRSLGLANYVCSAIPPDDLLDMDLIILSHEYPRDSSFLKSAQEHKVPIEYPETLFFKKAPPVTVIGIIGVCGKSTVMSMLAPILECACSALDGQGFYTIDPESGDGILSHLKKIKSGDIVLLRFVETLVEEMRSLRISPQVAVFTNVPRDYETAEELFKVTEFQTYNNFIIAPDSVVDRTHNLRIQPKAKMLRTRSAMIPVEWEFKGRGIHDRENAALALQAARLFKVTDEEAQNGLAKWKPLKGRLEFIKKVKNVEFYNDSAAVRADATLTAIQTIGEPHKTILIFGGAISRGDYHSLFNELPRYVRAVILLPGSGTMHQRSTIEKIEKIKVLSAPSIEESVHLAFEQAQKGDRVIFSPGFDALGLECSRKDRGEKFVRAVRSL